MHDGATMGEKFVSIVVMAVRKYANNFYVAPSFTVLISLKAQRLKIYL
ncbi:hypothetical protein MED121_16684 [Marinomonas sp. MED121]|nr:hypothetical protein MED121_16684 [Marinomonas sp. MED121]